MDITEEYVEKVKNQTKLLAKNDLMDVSYITKELLSHEGTFINESSLEISVYYGIDGMGHLTRKQVKA